MLCNSNLNCIQFIYMHDAIPCHVTKKISCDPYRRAAKSGVSPEAPVVMYQLRKEYPGSSGAPTHVAVHSVSMAIQRNECFGLLGPNGQFVVYCSVAIVVICHLLVRCLFLL